MLMPSTTAPFTLPDTQNAPQSGSTWAWFSYFTKPYRGMLLFYFGINLFRQAFFRMLPYFFAVLIGLVESGRAKAEPELIIGWIGIYAALSMLATVTLYLIIPGGLLMDRVAKVVSLYGFQHYLTLPESWHENRASGEKLQRLLTARKSTYDLLETIFWQVIPLPAAGMVVIFSILSLQAPTYYIALFFGMVISYLFFAQISVTWMQERYASFNKTLENVIAGVYEFVVSTATVRFFNLKDHVLQRGQTLELANHQSRRALFKTIFRRWFWLDTMALLWIISITLLVTFEAVHNTVSLSALTVIIFLTASIWQELENFALVTNRLIEHWEGFKRLTEILNTSPQIIDKSDAFALPRQPSEITFDTVSFSYTPARPVIHDFTLRIPPGQKVGLIGPSGAGKSTIIKLLLRFYDTDSGRVTIGGHDVRDLSAHSIQDIAAVIPQDAVLFNHPLLDNIRYGNLNAPEADIITAAKQAHAHEFIETLPQGYQTLVGERGVKLSGGQRQRIAIARAILKNAPILILDEATAALDSESEHYIQESLRDLMQGKTVIAIAHRLSTIAALDRLIVMDQGQIIEDGTHAELLASGGLYARLWARQSGGFLAI